MYFHKAPNKEEFHAECLRKIKALHQFDVLRANKSTQAFGLEVRVPFLDKAFLDLAMTIDPAEKMICAGRIEKWMVRKAFADGDYLPDDILWRQKEQFSDGVGYSWIDGLRDHAAALVTDEQMANAARIFPIDTPRTKEAFWYRSCFDSHFPEQSAVDTVPRGPSIACSSPAALQWDASFQANADPSGRALLGVHIAEQSFAPATKRARVA